MTSAAGVIDELVAGAWCDPATGERHTIPIEHVAIERSLAGAEAELVRRRHGTARVCVVHDEVTRAVLGERVMAALTADGGADEFVWREPRCTPEGATALSEATRGADALVAVGSGTISDTVKLATHRDGRAYSVFATSPMNAYTTPTASVTEDGHKRSRTCHSAKGVFFDLDVLAGCPQRLVAAAFADVVCRTTAQADWLLSHLVTGTPYSEVAYRLIAIDEDALIEAAPRLREGDADALAILTRVSVLMGLSTSFTGTTHVGSMGEHMISHAIDMFANAHEAGGHPGTSHGEQVGAATLTMSRLQEEMIASGVPTMRPTAIPLPRLTRRYGVETVAAMVDATEPKRLDDERAAHRNARLATRWDDIVARLRAVMRPRETLHAAMRAAGCKLGAEDLGLSREFYAACVRDARFIRDRYTMLDMADDSGRLESFVDAIS